MFSKQDNMYFSLIEEGMGYVKEDLNVKSMSKAWRLLKKDIEEFTEENDFEFEEDCISFENKKTSRFSSVEIFYSLNFEIKFNEKRNSDYYFSDIYYIRPENDVGYSKYKAVLFALNWLIKERSKENFELLKETVSKMKLDYLADKKISQIHDVSLKGSLDRMSERYKIKYQIEQYNTFCMVTFKLRPYYKLQMKLSNSEFLSQLEEAEHALKNALELSGLSVLPSVILNRNLKGASYGC